MKNISAIGALSTSRDNADISNLIVAFGLYEQGITQEMALTYLEPFDSLMKLSIAKGRNLICSKVLCHAEYFTRSDLK